jgi:ABC-type multidrug transport system permease subunit
VRNENLNKQKLNYLVDLILTTLFFIVAFTGLFMHFFIPSGVQRGRYIVYMGLTKATWIWIHSKAGILITIIVIIHLILHWKWIVCATRNMFRKEKCDL